MYAWFDFLTSLLLLSEDNRSIATRMAEEEDTRDVRDFYADIPVDFKNLRCCLRCSLLKSYDQVFYTTWNIPFSWQQV